MKTAVESRKKFILLFTDKTSLWLPRLLKRGFRHCKVIVETGGGWLFVNPLAEEIKAFKLPPLPVENLCDFYREIGFTVIWGYSSRVKSYQQPTDCVAVSKRLIGVRSRWVRTPYQLFKFLIRRKLAFSGS